MSLDTDQTHQAVSNLTMNWCRQRLLYDDLVHDANAKARVTNVNSVSLQPMFAADAGVGANQSLT